MTQPRKRTTKRVVAKKPVAKKPTTKKPVAPEEPFQETPIWDEMVREHGDPYRPFAARGRVEETRTPRTTMTVAQTRRPLGSVHLPEHLPETLPATSRARRTTLKGSANQVKPSGRRK